MEQIKFFDQSGLALLGWRRENGLMSYFHLWFFIYFYFFMYAIDICTHLNLFGVFCFRWFLDFESIYFYQILIQVSSHFLVFYPFHLIFISFSFSFLPFDFSFYSLLFCFNTFVVRSTLGLVSLAIHSLPKQHKHNTPNPNPPKTKKKKNNTTQHTNQSLIL